MSGQHFLRKNRTGHPDCILIICVHLFYEQKFPEKTFNRTPQTEHRDSSLSDNIICVILYLSHENEFQYEAKSSWQVRSRNRDDVAQLV